MVSRYEVPEQNLAQLAQELDRLCKRAAKLGKSLSWREDGECFETRKRKDVEYVQRYVVVVIDGEAPVIDGWAFLGTLQHTESGENLLRTVPGAQNVPVEYRTAAAWCEHCQLRRLRNDTFLVRNVDVGTVHQVGRNCLRDFTGHKDPHTAASYAELLSSLDGMIESYRDPDAEGSGRFVWYLQTEDVLAWTSLVIRKDGWLSRKAAQDSFRGMATADAVVLLNSYRRTSSEQQWAESYGKPEAADVELASKVLAWVQTLPEDTTSDYLWNLRVACGRDYTSIREVGLVASAVAAYLRDVEEALKRAKRAESIYEGTVGKRGIFVVTVVDKREIESMYGLSTLVRFQTQAGNVMLWFASGDVSWLALGETYKVKATVKKHEAYRGVKQTQVNRVAEV